MAFPNFTYQGRALATSTPIEGLVVLIVVGTVVSIVLVIAVYIICVKYRHANIQVRQVAPAEFEIDVVQFEPKATALPMDESRAELESGAAAVTQCGVCLIEYGAGDSLGVLDCGHSFHEECLRSWLTKSRGAAACPLCRNRVSIRPARPRMKEVNPRSRFIPESSVAEQHD